MSDISPYGITQNANSELVTADELVGQRSGSIRENAVFGSAAGFSTAPYLGGPKVNKVIPPPPPLARKRCIGRDGECLAYPINGTDLCVFHTPGQTRRDRMGPGESPTAP
jgi:hypothetical protein